MCKAYKIGSKAKYIADHGYFSKIDTEEKAYWLGFIAADGSVNDKGSLRIELDIKDREHIELFKNTIKYDGVIHDTVKNCCIFTIYSPKIVNDLAKYFIIPNKTLIIKTPNIRKDLLRHYYRGFFDGDGWIGIRKQKIKSGVCKTYAIDFCSGSEQLMVEIYNWIIQNIGFKCGTFLSRTNSRGHKTFQLAFDGGRIFQYVYHLLYDNSNICLNRKKEILLDAEKHLRDTHRWLDITLETLKPDFNIIAKNYLLSK